jgi:hypothetical protein
MAKVELDLLGGKAVRRMFAIAAEKVGPQLAKEMNASALTIEKDAKRLAPANFGKLRQSIKHNIGEPLMKSVYSELGYAPYVEFGTKSKAMTNPIHKGFSAYAAQFILKNGIKPQPFLIPAYLNEKPKLIKRIVELLKFK